MRARRVARVHASVVVFERLNARFVVGTENRRCTALSYDERRRLLRDSRAQLRLRRARRSTRVFLRRDGNASELRSRDLNRHVNTRS